MSLYSIQSDATSIGAAANDGNGTVLRTMVDRLVQDLTAIKAALSPDDAGGIYLGGSVSANLLDDYEKGTFTPTLIDNSGDASEGQTYSVQAGFYIKIGDMIYFTLTVTMTNLGTLGVGNDARISSLPFQSSSDANSHVSITCSKASGLSLGASGENVGGEIIPTSNRIGLVLWDSTAGPTNLIISELTSAGSVTLSGNYRI